MKQQELGWLDRFRIVAAVLVVAILVLLLL